MISLGDMAVLGTAGVVGGITSEQERVAACY